MHTNQGHWASSVIGSCAVCEGMVALVAASGASAGQELYAQAHLEAGMADMVLAADQSCAGALKVPCTKSGSNAQRKTLGCMTAVRGVHMSPKGN